MVNEETSHPNKLSRIRGQVRSTDGRTLQSAVLACQGQETRTLADGTFILNDIPSATCRLSVSLEGFESVSKEVTLREGEETIQDFRLPEASGTAKICGHIFDAESRKPLVSGGTVMLILPVTNRYAHVDENGYYQFDKLPAGKHTIATSIPEYEDKNATQSVKNGETRTLDFFCRPLRAVEPFWG